jgi:PEP-CTERM motif
VFSGSLFITRRTLNQTLLAVLTLYMNTKTFSLPAIAFGFCLYCSVAQAAPFVIPTTVISGTDVFSGPTFTVSGNYGLNDIFSIEANGTVDLASGDFTANAAGVIVSPSTTNIGSHPGETSPGTLNPSAPYAALLIGNDTLGFHILFPADASAGLGSSIVPTDIFATETIGEIFGTTIADGTTLELRVNDDLQIDDNSGSFTLTGTISPAPEPTTLALAGLGGLASLVMFRRRRQ